MWAPEVHQPHSHTMMLSIRPTFRDRLTLDARAALYTLKVSNPVGGVAFLGARVEGLMEDVLPEASIGGRGLMTDIGRGSRTSSEGLDGAAATVEQVWGEVQEIKGRGRRG